MHVISTELLLYCLRGFEEKIAYPIFSRGYSEGQLAEIQALIDGPFVYGAIDGLARKQGRTRNAIGVQKWRMRKRLA